MHLVLDCEFSWMEVNVRFGHQHASSSVNITHRSLRPYFARAEQYLRHRSERDSDLR